MKTLKKELQLVKKVLEARRERMKHWSYWANRVFQLALLVLFKEEVLELTDWFVQWCRANITISKVFHAFAFAGFMGAMGIIFVSIVMTLAKGKKFEDFPDEVESILKKMDSLLMEGLARL